MEILAGKIDRAATGSPQPPPGGGLHPCAVRKQAGPLGCGLLRKINRAAIGGLQLILNIEF